MADEASDRPADAARRSLNNIRTDGSLVRQVREGDQDAATILYERYAKRLRRLARKRSSAALARLVDGDDLVQSVFGSFIRGVNDGSYDAPAGKELWKLLLVMTLNKIRRKAEYYNAIKRDHNRLVHGEEIEHVPDPLASNAQAMEVLKMTFEEALERLSSDTRQAIRLRMEEFEVVEIADAMGRSKRSVERLLQAGLKRIREQLGD